MQTSTHSSQMKTEGPAISEATSRSLLAQNEQRRSAGNIQEAPGVIGGGVGLVLLFEGSFFGGVFQIAFDIRDIRLEMRAQRLQFMSAKLLLVGSFTLCVADALRLVCLLYEKV
jgi:hypothetical protein